MWEFTCQQNIYRLTYKDGSRPICWNDSVVHLDGYDASKWLRYCITVKLIWTAKTKQMKVWIISKHVGYFMWKYIYRLTYKTASPPTGWDVSEGHLDGYDASLWLRNC